MMKKELEERLARMSPLRVILRKKETGEHEGLIEHSFAMGWHAHRALIYWSGKAYSFLGEHILNADEDARANLPYYKSEGAQVFDPLAEDCPVVFDIESWLEEWEKDASSKNKFNTRNALFERGRAT